MVDNTDASVNSLTISDSDSSSWRIYPEVTDTLENVLVVQMYDESALKWVYVTSFKAP